MKSVAVLTDESVNAGMLCFNWRECEFECLRVNCQ